MKSAPRAMVDLQVIMQVGGVALPRNSADAGGAAGYGTPSGAWHLVGELEVKPYVAGEVLGEVQVIGNIGGRTHGEEV